MLYRENQWQVVDAANKPFDSHSPSNVCCFPYTKQVHRNIQVRERLLQVMSSASVGSNLSVDDLQSKLRLLERQQQSLQWRTQFSSPKASDFGMHESPKFSLEQLGADVAERQETTTSGVCKAEDERDDTSHFHVETALPVSAPTQSKRFLKRQRLSKKKRMIAVPSSILETIENSIDFLHAADQAFHRQVDEIMRDVRQM